jgi:hypothetical protein
MNKKLLLINLLLVTGLLLTACGPSSLIVQLPGTNNPNPGPPATDNITMTLVYVLLGALVVIALAALLGGKRGSQ